MAIDLCGESGLVNKITQTQKELNELITGGKNALFAVTSKINQAKTFIDAAKNDPDVVKRTLQEDILDLISRESLRNPVGAAAKLLRLRAAYQSADAAVQRIFDNVQQFIRDPLNTPLDVCKDIPNIQLLGNEFVELVKPAKIPDPNKSPKVIRQEVEKEHDEILSIESTTSEASLDNFSEQVVKTSPRYPTPDIANDINLGGRYQVTEPCRIGPGSAQVAATSGGNLSYDQAFPTLANPAPVGRQFTTPELSPSQYASNIAKQLNTLNSNIRELFFKGIKDFLDNSFSAGFDVNITEAFRPSGRSIDLANSQSSREQAAMAFFVSRGYTKEQAAGIVGNLIAESNMNPSAIARNDAGPGRDSKGIAQWNRERLAALETYARSKGVPFTDFQTQLEFIDIELNGTERRAGNELRNSGDVAQATLAITRYERFRGYEQGFNSPETQKRVRFANRVFVENSRIAESPPLGGESWHNYGLAADLAIYVNGEWDIDNEQIDQLSRYMAKYGIVNDRPGDRGHFYVAALGKDVPEELKLGKISVADLTKSAGIRVMA